MGDDPHADAGAEPARGGEPDRAERDEIRQRAWQYPDAPDYRSIVTRARHRRHRPVGANLACRLHDGVAVHRLVRPGHARWRLDGTPATSPCTGGFTDAGRWLVVGRVRNLTGSSTSPHGAYSWQTDVEPSCAPTSGTPRWSAPVSGRRRRAGEHRVVVRLRADTGGRDRLARPQQRLRPGGVRGHAPVPALGRARWTAVRHAAPLHRLRSWEEPRRLI